MENKQIKKLKEAIESIEQLGADARYWNDYEKYEMVRQQLEGIKFWASKGLKTINKIKEEAK